METLNGPNSHCAPNKVTAMEQARKSAEFWRGELLRYQATMLTKQKINTHTGVSRDNDTSSVHTTSFTLPAVHFPAGLKPELLSLSTFIAFLARICCSEDVHVGLVKTQREDVAKQTEDSLDPAAEAGQIMASPATLADQTDVSLERKEVRPIILPGMFSVDVHSPRQTVFDDCIKVIERAFKEEMFIKDTTFHDEEIRRLVGEIRHNIVLMAVNDIENDEVEILAKETLSQCNALVVLSPCEMRIIQASKSDGDSRHLMGTLRHYPVFVSSLFSLSPEDPILNIQLVSGEVYAKGLDCHELPHSAGAHENLCLLQDGAQPKAEQADLFSLFLDQTLKSPQSIALTSTKCQMTYAETLQVVTDLADLLGQNLPESYRRHKKCVGLYLPKSLAYVISTLACVRAGCPFLPLPADLPAERLVFTLRDAQVEVMITEEAMYRGENFPTQLSGSVALSKLVVADLTVVIVQLRVGDNEIKLTRTVAYNGHSGVLNPINSGSSEDSVHFENGRDDNLHFKGGREGTACMTDACKYCTCTRDDCQSSGDVCNNTECLRSDCNDIAVLESCGKNIACLRDGSKGNACNGNGCKDSIPVSKRSRAHCGRREPENVLLPETGLENGCKDTVHLRNVHEHIADLEKGCSISHARELHGKNSVVLEDDCCYVIYTSGSTGRPKGVQVLIPGVVNMARGLIAYLDLQATDITAQFASIGFDTSIWEMFPTLLSGGTLAVLYEKERMGKEFVKTIAQLQVNVITLTPSVINLYEPSDLPTLMKIVSAGEICMLHTALRWTSSPGSVRFFNSYGPTETTVGATVYEFKPEHYPDSTNQALSIGTAMMGVHVYLLDGFMKPVAPGVVGEIYIGGAGVSAGYIGHAAGQNASRFVKNSFLLDADRPTSTPVRKDPRAHDDPRMCAGPLHGCARAHYGRRGPEDVLLLGTRQQTTTAGTGRDTRTDADTRQQTTSAGTGRETRTDAGTRQQTTSAGTGRETRTDAGTRQQTTSAGTGRETRTDAGKETQTAGTRKWQYLLHKSGDHAFQDSFGRFTFVGRIDNQVKIRGQRVDLGELEQVLMQVTQVEMAVVVRHRCRIRSSAQNDTGVMHKGAGVTQSSADVMQPDSGDVVTQTNASVTNAHPGMTQMDPPVMQTNNGMTQPNAGAMQPNSGVTNNDAGVTYNDDRATLTDVGETQTDGSVTRTDSGLTQTAAGETHMETAVTQKDIPTQVPHSVGGVTHKDVGVVTRSDAGLMHTNPEVMRDDTDTDVTLSDARMKGSPLLEPTIAAFVTPASVCVEDLMQHLSRTLPKFMIPNFMRTLDAKDLPMSINGKIDRAALETDESVHHAQFSLRGAQLSESQLTVAKLWVDVLGLDDHMSNIHPLSSFKALGGSSIHLVILQNTIEETFHLAVSFDDMSAADTIEDFCEIISQAQGVSKESKCVKDTCGRQQLRSMILEDSCLEDVSEEFINGIYAEDAISLIPSSNGSLPSELGTNGMTFLVSGVTGFLGAFLLHELLTQTHSRVTCLVRGKSATHAADRVVKNLTKYGLWREAYSERVTVVLCDISQPRLGLEPQAYRVICQEVDAVFVNAAKVNFNTSYRDHRRTNVLGTREFIRIAMTGKRKFLFLVSSLSVFLFPPDTTQSRTEHRAWSSLLEFSRLSDVEHVRPPREGQCCPPDTRHSRPQKAGQIHILKTGHSSSSDDTNSCSGVELTVTKESRLRPLTRLGHSCPGSDVEQNHPPDLIRNNPKELICQPRTEHVTPQETKHGHVIDIGTDYPSYIEHTEDHLPVWVQNNPEEQTVSVTKSRVRCNAPDSRLCHAHTHPHAMKETDMLSDPLWVEGGYGQSKWASDRLVQQALPHLPGGAIFRPGHVTGRSTDGVGPDDMFARCMMGMPELGCIPDVDFLFDLLPVDYCSKAIVEIAVKCINPPAAGTVNGTEVNGAFGDSDCMPSVYHLYNQDAIPFKDLFPGLRVVSLADWRRKLRGLRRDSPLVPLTPYFMSSIWDRVRRYPTFCTCNANKHVSAKTACLLRPARELLSVYRQYFESNRLLEAAAGRL